MYDVGGLLCVLVKGEKSVRGRLFLVRVGGAQVLAITAFRFVEVTSKFKV